MLIIRRFLENDIEELYRLLSNPEVMEYIETPFSKEKTVQFFKDAGLKNPPLIYAVEDNDSFIGYVIYHDYDEDSVEVGWLLLPEYWNKGYASRLTEMLIEKTLPTGKQIVIECSPSQGVSKHIAEKYGFTYEGCIDGVELFRLYP